VQRRSLEEVVGLSSFWVFKTMVELGAEVTSSFEAAPYPEQLRDALPREEAGGARAACGVEDMSEVLVVAAV
jgi:hypothetical protein